MTKLKKAGLVLYYVKDDDIFFRCMIPSDPQYGGSSPQIPKGTIDEGDSPKFTAIKECIEECGLLPLNLASIEEFKVYPSMKMAIYIGTVNNTDSFSKPHWESKWSGWVSYNKDRHKLRNLQLHIFDDIVQHIMAGEK